MNVRQRRSLPAILMLAACGAAPAAWAHDTGPRGWYDLSPDEQQRAWQNYQRYQQLPNRKRQAIEERYRQYQSLPPQERQQLRQNYDAYRGLDAGKKREFGEKYRRWKSRR
jgi:hypothetical protein